MFLKRTDKLGNKYYIDAFTGQTVIIPLGNPLKREPNAEIARAMNNSSLPLFGQGDNLKRLNNLRSALIGEYKAIMRVKPRKRDKKEFIKICKRVNVNPYSIMNVCV